MKISIITHLILLSMLFLWREDKKPKSLKVTIKQVQSTPQAVVQGRALSVTSIIEQSSSCDKESIKEKQKAITSIEQPPLSFDKEGIKEPQKAVAPAAKVPQKIATKSDAMQSKDSRPIEKKISSNEAARVPVKKASSQAVDSSVVAKKKKERGERLAALAVQGLQNLEKGSYKETYTSNTLSIEGLKSESLLYTQKLTDLLSRMMTLPEQSDVLIQLTLNRQGRVMNCQIIESISNANKDYVLRLLPAMQLPPLEDPWKKDEQHTFSIRLVAQQKD